MHRLPRRQYSCLPLTTYVQTRPWANAIEEQALRRHMPPWHAVSGYGEFANDLGLTAREVQFLVAWAERNGPKSADQTVFTNLGNLKLSTEDVVLRPDFDQWKLGKPDLLQRFPSTKIVQDSGNTVAHVDGHSELDAWIVMYKRTATRDTRSNPG
jgi:hypothetical protein